jgi:hypothetical protein
MKIYMFVALLFIPWIAYSQYHVIGEVQNKEHIPIEFGEVLLYKNKHIVHSVLTDSLGKFSLPTDSGSYILEIRQLGNVLFTKQLQIIRLVNLGIISVENSTDLKEVVITQHRKIFKQEGDKLLFDVENSGLSKGYNSVDILKRSPKLKINSDGDILLRNSSAIILINGKELKLTGQSLNDYLSSISSENIKTVEIQDVASSETEASNKGGVVNIILKKNPKGFNAIIKSSYEYRKDDYGVYKAGTNLNYGSDKWNIYLNANLLNNKNWGVF